MSKPLLGLLLIVVGVVCAGFAILMSIGVLLEFSRPGALYAVLFWVISGFLVVVGVVVRRS